VAQKAKVMLDENGTPRAQTQVRTNSETKRGRTKESSGAFT